MISIAGVIVGMLIAFALCMIFSIVVKIVSIINDEHLTIKGDIHNLYKKVSDLEQKNKSSQAGQSSKRLKKT